jgi:acyl-CoA hydrolase
MNKQEKSLYMTVLMTPEMANLSGNVHGGAILKLLDQVAYACAARYCKSYMGKNGRSIPVPPLQIETELERRLFEAGKMRQELMERNKALHVSIRD